MNNSHFIDFGPTCWNNRTIITESRYKRSDDTSMDELIHRAMLANFKSERKRPHVSISTDSQRYKERRISKERLEKGEGNRWDSVASTEPYVIDTVNTIFNLIPQLKGSGALTGYIRYALTNRWTNRYQFSARDMDKLAAAVQANDVNKQKDILSYLVDKRKTDKIKAGDFLSYDNDKKMRNIEAWRKLKAITNPYFNKANAEEFINAEEPKQIEILKKWGMVTLPTSEPSALVVRYCSNKNVFNAMTKDAHKINGKVDAEDIQKDFDSGKFEREATAQGVTDADRSILRDILLNVHDSHRDLRDYDPDELAAKEEENRKKMQELVGDINAEEDWSQDEDDDEL